MAKKPGSPERDAIVAEKDQFNSAFRASVLGIVIPFVNAVFAQHNQLRHSGKSRKAVADRTQAACAAIAAFCWEELVEPNLTERDMARRVAVYAVERGIEGAALLAADDENSAFRQLCGAAIRAMQQAEHRKR